MVIPFSDDDHFDNKWQVSMSWPMYLKHGGDQGSKWRGCQDHEFSALVYEGLYCTVPAYSSTLPGVGGKRTGDEPNVLQPSWNFWADWDQKTHTNHGYWLCWTETMIDFTTIRGAAFRICTPQCALVIKSGSTSLEIESVLATGFGTTT